MANIDFNDVLGNNWDPDFHKTGQKMPMRPTLFGLTVIDWDGQFTKRIRKLGTSDLTIPFQYLESIPAWSKAANFNDISDIIGRFEPLTIYTNSAAQELTLVLIYNAELLKGTKTDWSLENIEIFVKRLQSLVFPQYDNNFSDPVKLFLNIGNIYKDVPIRIKNVQVESEAPFHVTTGLPLTRKVTLECRVSYPLWQGLYQSQIWTAYEGNFGNNGPNVFAYEELGDKYIPGGLKRTGRRGDTTIFS
jgi:hypothetical protein